MTPSKSTTVSLRKAFIFVRTRYVWGSSSQFGSRVFFLFQATICKTKPKAIQKRSYRSRMALQIELAVVAPVIVFTCPDAQILAGMPESQQSYLNPRQGTQIRDRTPKS